MNLGSLFLLAALLLFLFAWLSVTIIPEPIAGGLFCLTLGVLLSGVGVPWRKEQGPK